mmetsp:Transcript_26591/g.86172  ORF Transcript_26591/g.86172 Transcript_26591/m.86172 type:complete len:233 (-) Transcript_26591:2440-3138(-)
MQALPGLLDLCAGVAGLRAEAGSHSAPLAPAHRRGHRHHRRRLGCGSASAGGAEAAIGPAVQSGSGGGIGDVGRGAEVARRLAGRRPAGQRGCAGGQRYPRFGSASYGLAPRREAGPRPHRDRAPHDRWHSTRGHSGVGDVARYTGQFSQRGLLRVAPVVDVRGAQGLSCSTRSLAASQSVPADCEALATRLAGGERAGAGFTTWACLTGLDLESDIHNTSRLRLTYRAHTS